MNGFQSEIAPQSVYTVSELNQEIKTLLETTIPAIWLEGEISNLKIHSSGHVYFSLKDRDSQIPAVMWRTRFADVFFTPQDGMKVIALGKIAVFHKRGYYQFDVIKLKPAGVGELQLAFEQLKEKLLKEGLFDENHKKPIPDFPESIGIVTSPTGAAIQDLLNILNRRFPGLEIILIPAKVQGEGAAQEIAAAVEVFNAYGKVDVIIVGRGGGSLEDLWAFNEEVVARAIFQSKIPVISAVGHEIDFTISDFVADLRAPTPSAAAELAVPNKTELLHRINIFRKTLLESGVEKIQSERDRLDRLSKSYAFLRSPDLLRQQQQRLDELLHSLILSSRHRLSIWNKETQNLQQRLLALSPQAVLKRGFSICLKEKNKQIVKDAKELAAQDRITLKFFKGGASGVVEGTNDEDFFK